MISGVLVGTLQIDLLTTQMRYVTALVGFKVRDDGGLSLRSRVHQIEERAACEGGPEGS